MRSLPWLTKEAGRDEQPENVVKQHKEQNGDLKLPEPAGRETSQNPESSDSDDTTILGDNTFDAMIPGYENDDAYIMVEHDLLEAAKQVTRHLHLAAYQKNATAPIHGDIVRPTISPKQNAQVEGTANNKEDENMNRGNTLGNLLKHRPAVAPIAAATPLKRERDNSPIESQDGRQEAHASKPSQDTRLIQSHSRGQFADVRKRGHEIEGDVADDEEDEEDEDLERPRKVQNIEYFS